MTIWKVVCTESRQEHRATVELARRGFSVYLPRETVTSFVRGRKITACKPLFPGYTFAEPCPQWPRLYSVPGVLSGRGATLPGEVTLEEMGRIRHAEIYLAERARRPEEPGIEAGETLQIVDGPFAGHNAYVTAVDSDARIALLVHLFGSPTRVIVSASQLARI